MGTEDDTFRRLTQSNREIVKAEILDYKNGLSSRSRPSDNVVSGILRKHGWTLAEYVRHPTSK